MNIENELMVREVDKSNNDWLRFQAGVTEFVSVLSRKGNDAIKVPMFRMMGYGATRDEALAMAGRFVKKKQPKIATTD